MVSVCPHCQHRLRGVLPRRIPECWDAGPFIDEVERLPVDESKAKIVIHQAARLLWLADRIDEVARGRPALLVMFYLIAAEAVAKIVFGFAGQGQSRKYVRRFFQDICSEQHRARLGRAFCASSEGYLDVLEVVDLLYKVRCDVVHEGQYFNFMLPDRAGMEGLLIGQDEGQEDDTLEARITARELRQIVLEGCLLGAARILPLNSPVRTLIC